MGVKTWTLRTSIVKSLCAHNATTSFSETLRVELNQMHNCMANHMETTSLTKGQQTWTRVSSLAKKQKFLDLTTAARSQFSCQFTSLNWEFHCSLSRMNRETIPIISRTLRPSLIEVVRTIHTSTHTKTRMLTLRIQLGIRAKSCINSHLPSQIKGTHNLTSTFQITPPNYTRNSFLNEPS